MALERTQIVQTFLANGTIINVEAENLGGEEYIALELRPAFEEISTSIEGIAKTIVTTLQHIKPSKGTVEFGLQIAVENGKLTTLLVKGSASASLKIILEWEGEFSTGS